MSLSIRVKIIVLILFLVSLVSGCANIQYQSSAPYQKNLIHTISRSKLLDDTHYTLKHLNVDKTVLYHQNFSDATESVSFWGGIALASATVIGPLMGPVGEAYVMSDIEQKTERDVMELKNNIKFEPAKLFAESIEIIPRLRLVKYEGQNEITRISPYIYITNSNNDELLFSAAIIVQDRENTISKWQGQYTYQLPLSLPKRDVIDGLSLSQVEHMEAEFKKGFKKISELYLRDRGGELQNQYSVRVKSDLLSPRFDFSFPAELILQDEESIIVRASTGIYILPRAYTEVE